MAISSAQLKISDEEYRTRCDKLLEIIQQKNCDGVVLFDSTYILYYAGFAFIPTERPIGFVMNSKGERGMFVPRLEVEHAQANALIDRVDHYIEYPDIPHPMQGFKTMLQEMGVKQNIALDHDGYPWVFGYRGESISTLMDTQVIYIKAEIEDQMMIKSPAEIRLIKESCKWGNLALMLLQRYTEVGKTESEVEQRASHEANTAMLDTLGPIYRAQKGMTGGLHAIYRGQIGRNAAIPHALANNIVFQAGDILIGESDAPVWGYGSELERTMILGKPTDQQKMMFDHMLTLQQLAFENIQPGRKCSDVDRVIRAYYEKHDLKSHWKHHTGHAIGLRYHEAPFLDVGDATEIKVGMVFTVEPGLYADDLGGFRHSDTVAVTENGIEFLTYYPRDLESLTIPI